MANCKLYYSDTSDNVFRATIDLRQVLLKLPFGEKSPSRAASEEACVLQERFSALLDKKAVQTASMQQQLIGIYSRYVLVPKKEGSGLRPNLDLHALNKYLRRHEFGMFNKHWYDNSSVTW